METREMEYVLLLIKQADSFPAVEQLRIRFLAKRDGMFSFKGAQKQRDQIEDALASATERLWAQVVPPRALGVGSFAYGRGWRIANGDYFNKLFAESDRVLLAEAAAKEWAILCAGPGSVADAREGRHSAWRVVARGPADGHRDAIERADAWLMENGTAEMCAESK